MRSRCMDGRSISAGATQFLGWLTERLTMEGTTTLWLVWGKVSRHISQAVRAWCKAHIQLVKQNCGCRVVVCPLPIKSPWLKRIEPQP